MKRAAVRANTRPLHPHHPAVPKCTEPPGLAEDSRAPLRLRPTDVRLSLARTVRFSRRLLCIESQREREHCDSYVVVPLEFLDLEHVVAFASEGKML